MRGAQAKAPANAIRLNVTSAQRHCDERRIFSPMTEVDSGYKGYFCFENYWQSGKVWSGIDHAVSVAWWQAQKEPRRRYAHAKNCSVSHAVFPHIDEKLNYIDSRKRVYVPEYHALTLEKGSALIKKYVRAIEEGKCVAIYDFDGPRGADKTPLCEEVTLELLKEKINDATFPFGHGYVVAAILLGIPYESFV